MPDSITDVLVNLRDSQDNEEEHRSYGDEADMFINVRGGQWEDAISNSWGNKPKYTFDQCTPVIDGIMSDMEETDFAIKVLPTGGKASKEIAEKYAGLVRNIENASNARFIYNAAARKMATSGISGWRIRQRFKDGDSFYQELMIDQLLGFRDRVWYNVGAVKPTMEDAKQCWVLTSIPLGMYEEEFPEGSKMSVHQDMYNPLWNTNEGVVIGEWYFKVETKRTLALLSNNQIVVMDDDFDKVRDEMFAKGVTVEQTRDRTIDVVHHRFFDGKEFLTDREETVFEYLPIIPCYANFDVYKNNIIYYGAIEKLMDPARVLNYAESKKLAESALKPFDKVWMTKDQAKSPRVRRSLETQNTNTEPVQLYDFVPDHPLPFKPQATQMDSVLIESAKSAQAYIDRNANLYDAQRGIGLSGQAEETLRLLQNKGSAANYKYIKAMELAITHTAKVCCKALPKTLTPKQEVRILKEDGTPDTFIVGEEIFDRQSRKMIVINDLSVGSYDITCSAGPAYRTKQQEAVKNILEASAIDPSIVQLGGDLLFGNMPGIGMTQLAERKRLQVFNAGGIPEAQMTDEEKAIVEEAKKKPPEMSPMDRANLGIAEAEQKKADAQTQDVISKMQERQEKGQLQLQKMLLDYQTKQEERQSKREDKVFEAIMANASQLKTQAETLKILREAMGAEGLVSPSAMIAYRKQAIIVQDAQVDQ